MKTTKDQDRVVEEARRWIGTPFYAHQAVLGVGADCVQMALAIYKAVGMIPKEASLPEYRLTDGDHLYESLVEEWLETTGHFTREDFPLPGRLITLRVGRVAHHVGIVTGPLHFVQAIRRRGVREWDLYDSTWQSRLTGIWKANLCSEAQST